MATQEFADLYDDFIKTFSKNVDTAMKIDELNLRAEELRMAYIKRQQEAALLIQESQARVEQEEEDLHGISKTKQLSSLQDLERKRSELNSQVERSFGDITNLREDIKSLAEERKKLSDDVHKREQKLFNETQRARYAFLSSSLLTSRYQHEFLNMVTCSKMEKTGNTLSGVLFGKHEVMPFSYNTETKSSVDLSNELWALLEASNKEGKKK